MTSDLVSLAVITLIAVVTPFIVRLIPRRAIPEVVLLIFAGALFGPNLAGFIVIDDSMNLLSNLGMSFLFLLAGFEIDPKNLVKGQGRTGLITWFASFGIGIVVLLILQSFANLTLNNLIPVAIMLTTTALGTLLPILKDRGLLGTPVGDSVLAYGTWGELAPIIAVALLLSTRAAWLSLLILIAFTALAVIIATQGKRLARIVKLVNQDLEMGIHLEAATRVRLVVMLLVVLLAVASVFDLDIILAAFATGFILRYLVPEDDETFNKEVETIANGFFIPLFFVISGAGIDFSAVAQKPLMLIIFIILLLFVRGIPIAIALKFDSRTRDLPFASRRSITLYCVTALPLIVAITSATVSAGTMSSDVASVFVAAGAITVLIMPLLSGITASFDEKIQKLLDPIVAKLKREK